MTDLRALVVGRDVVRERRKRITQGHRTRYSDRFGAEERLSTACSLDAAPDGTGMYLIGISTLPLLKAAKGGGFALSTMPCSLGHLF